MCKSSHIIFKETCRDCRSLQKEWSNYLAKTGFIDIERGENLTTPQINHVHDFRTVVEYEAKRNYYDWARSKVNDGKFQSTKDLLIWECHSEGMSRDQMAPQIGYEPSWISRKIKKIEHYLKEQAMIFNCSSVSGSYAVAR